MIFFSGSPLVVSLIGALFHDFPNRWEYYLRQLQNKQFKRIRKSSSYDYEALDEAMSISVGNAQKTSKIIAQIFPSFEDMVTYKVIDGSTICHPYLWHVNGLVLRILLQRILAR